MQLQQRIDPAGPGIEGLPPLNIFRTISRAEPLTRGFHALGSHLLYGKALPAREREIVILRTGWRAQSEYEFGQHTRVGLAVGLTQDEVAWLAGGGGSEGGKGEGALV